MILQIFLAEIIILTLLNCLIAGEEEKCTTKSDIDEIKSVLVNLKNIRNANVTYAVTNEDSACRRHLQQVKAGLIKLTHQRRMMSKRYVSEDQYQQLKEDYDRQLRDVEEKLKEQQNFSNDSLHGELAGLMDKTEELIKAESELGAQLRTWDATNDRLRKELFDHMMAKNDIVGAVKRFSQMKSDYYIEAIFHDLAWRHNKSVDIMIQLLAVIRDLDDRTEALVLVYENAKKYYELNVESDLSLLQIEAEVIKVQNWIAEGGFVTFIQRRKLANISIQLDIKTEQIASKLMDYDSKKLENLKHIFGKLQPSQMKKIAKVICLCDYNQQRRFVSFLAILPNYNKIYALEEMIESGKRSLQFSIMWTLNEMEQISGSLGQFNQSFVDEVRNKLGRNVKSIMKCTDKLIFINYNGNCIHISEGTKTVLKFRTSETFRKVLLVDSSRCTTFQLIPLNETNEFFSIVGHGGRKLVVSESDFGRREKYVTSEQSSGSVSENAQWLVEPSDVTYFHIRTYRIFSRKSIVNDLWSGCKDNEEYVLITLDQTLDGENKDRLKWEMKCVE